MGVTVVMPCFNEEGRIDLLLKAMPAQISGHPVSLVVVDDASTDNSRSLVRSFIDRCGGPDSPKARLIEHPTNLGKGAALRSARSSIDRSSFDALIWMDTDGQHPVSHLDALAAPVLGKDVHMCVGSRYLSPGGGSHQAPLNRRLVRRSCIKSVEHITGFTITDPFSGFRCFSPTAASLLDLPGSRYEAELESCFAIAEAGLTYTEVAIPRIYGPGTSKMAANGGALIGRLRVISGYARTIFAARNRTPETTRILLNG